MSQFRITLDGTECTVSLADVGNGVGWRARIVRSGAITREVTGFLPDICASSSDARSLVEKEFGTQSRG
jgi:hypothetical protein